MKIKIGDKVKVLNDILGDGTLKNGDIGTVYETCIYGSEGLFAVEFPNGFKLAIDSSHKSIEFISDKQAVKSGTKHDTGKPRVSLIPRAAMLGMARALSYGEKKYGTHNYRNGLSYSRLSDAVLRHFLDFLEGIDNDEESGLPHLDHALAGLAMLKFMTVHRQDMDDRWLDPMYNPEEHPNEDMIHAVATELQKRGR